MATYTLGLIFSVDDGTEVDDFMAAIQELIDDAPEATTVDAATVTAPDGSVIDMLVETDIASAREHQTSVYTEPADPDDPHEPNTAENAVPTDKEL